MSSEKGNSVLELLLLLPLILFFLFIVIDAGLVLVQKASLHDAFRATTNSLPAHMKVLNNSEQAYYEVTQKIAEELEKNISNVFLSYSNLSNNYELFAFLYRLENDVITGGVLAKSVIRKIHIGNLSDIELLKPFDDTETYIENVLTKQSFAEPQGLILDPLDSSRSGQRYAANTWLLYLEVRAIPRGINFSFLRSTLGGLYSVQLQQLEKLRDY